MKVMFMRLRLWLMSIAKRQGRPRAPVILDIASSEVRRPCDWCDGGVLRRSRARNGFERLRRDLGSKRLFRCGKCGWRGWLDFVAYSGGPIGPIAEPDLSALDSIPEQEKPSDWADLA